MFKDVTSVPNYPELEQKVVDYWVANKIQEKVEKIRLEDNKKSGGTKEKVYYDGPITANNFPHYGHVITWTMKDVMPRYWTMLGYYVQRNMGWDCQGIPVELLVEKKLGFKDKNEIEKYGVDKFNQLCRESVLEFRDVMTKFESRFGRWMDLDNAYATMDPKYIESVWWSLKELHKKGYLYEGHKVVGYSTGAGTSLSNAEVDYEPYQEFKDTSVYVKFPLNYYKTGFGACVVITNEKDEVLMAIRTEPKRESVYGVVGGKADNDSETPMDVAKRECLEEISVLPKDLKEVGSSVDVFEGRLFHTYHFTATLPSSTQFKNTSETGEFKWVKKSEIPWDKIHIPTKNGLEDILGIREFEKVTNHKPKVYAIAWTTTPWTLPGNLMLSVGKKLRYVLVKVARVAKTDASEDVEYVVVAKDCVEKVFEDLSTLENVKSYTVIDEFDAKEMVNQTYKPLFDIFSNKKDEGAFKIIYADHVTTDVGTGIVHLAPYGAEDFDIFMKMGLTLFDYLDDTGHFTDLVPQYKGLFYKKANKEIVEYLKTNNLLLKVHEYAHMMPICWRTKVPLIYKPVKSWYVAITKYKDRILEENNKVNWVPDNVRTGRFGAWVNNARDWALSRSRYWGTPLPVWVNDKTGEQIVIGSFKELEELSGKKLGADFDPHRPFVDDITWQDKEKGKDGGTFVRVKDVIDVWYDSGSMPFAQHNYPFAEGSKELFEKRFPAEYIAESIDQTRGWFYSLMMINVGLFDKSPFKAVIVSGMLGAEDGKKLSKSLGNYPPMEEMVDKYGTDIFRYLMLSSPIVEAGNARFSYKFIDEAKKEFFTTLWNSYRYFVTYANLYNFKYDPKVVTDLLNSDSEDKVLDRWILIRLNEVIEKVRNGLDTFKLLDGTRELRPFVEDLSTWYIRRSRDRLSNGDSVALNVLYHVLLELVKLIAPFTPIISDEIYMNLEPAKNAVTNDEFETVHLAKYPESFKDASKNDPEWDHDEVLANMKTVREIASVGNAIRKEKNIAVKQPLAGLYLSEDLNLENGYLDILKDELNVKEIFGKDKYLKIVKLENYAGKDANLANVKTIGKDFVKLTVLLDLNITEELMIEASARELIREIQKLRKDSDVAWDAKLKVQYKSTPEFDKAVEKFADDIKSKTLTAELVSGVEFKVL